MTKRPYPCGTCGGSGLVVRPRKYLDPKGKVRTEESYEVCKSCGGSGSENVTMTVTVPITLDLVRSSPCQMTAHPPLR